MDNREIAELIANEVFGTCVDIVGHVDYMIEDGLIDQDYFRTNETAIWYLVDDLVFNCAVCGWNFETSELSDRDLSECVCSTCEDDY